MVARLESRGFGLDSNPASLDPGVGNQALCPREPRQQLHGLIRWLAGSFSNRQQAFENPPLYGHIMVRMRPVPHLAPGSLLLEQAYAVAPEQPYRVRVLRPVLSGEGRLQIENYAIQQDHRFWCAVEDSARLAELQADDLIPLVGCTYWVEPRGEGFFGAVEPGCGCMVQRNGVDTYLVSEFLLTQAEMQTIDRGHDPSTHEHIWGSIAGVFRFQRELDWSSELPPSWLVDEA